MSNHRNPLGGSQDHNMVTALSHGVKFVWGDAESSSNIRLDKSLVDDSDFGTGYCKRESGPVPRSAEIQPTLPRFVHYLFVPFVFPFRFFFFSSIGMGAGCLPYVHWEGFSRSLCRPHCYLDCAPMESSLVQLPRVYVLIAQAWHLASCFRQVIPMSTAPFCHLSRAIHYSHMPSANFYRLFHLSPVCFCHLSH